MVQTYTSWAFFQLCLMKTLPPDWPGQPALQQPPAVSSPVLYSPNWAILAGSCHGEPATNIYSSLEKYCCQNTTIYYLLLPRNRLNSALIVMSWIGECALTCSFPIFIGNMSQYCDYEEIEGLKWKTYLCHSWMRPPKMPARPCSAKDCPDSPLPKATPHSWTSARHGVPGLSWDMGEILVALCDSGGCGGGNVVVKLIWVHWDEKPRKNCFQTIYQHMDAQTVAFFGHPDCQESFSWTVISSAIFKSHPGTALSLQKPAQKHSPPTMWNPH